MDRLINENAVLSAIGEWIAHNEHTYTNATEYLRNRIKAIKTAEQEPTAKENLVVEDCISRQAVLDMVEDMTDQFGANHRVVTEGMISMLPPVTSKTDVLDKIIAEIETKYGQYDICEYFEDYDYEENDISEYRPIGNIADILQIIDKYKAESEDKE